MHPKPIKNVHIRLAYFAFAVYFVPQTSHTTNERIQMNYSHLIDVTVDSKRKPQITRVRNNEKEKQTALAIRCGCTVNSAPYKLLKRTRARALIGGNPITVAQYINNRFLNTQRHHGIVQYIHKYMRKIPMKPSSHELFYRIFFWYGCCCCCFRCCCSATLFADGKCVTDNIVNNKIEQRLM